MAIPPTAASGDDIQQQVVSMPMPDYLKDRIATVLIRNALIDARRIAVTVTGTRVVLIGTVRSSAKRAEAERIAWSAPDVTQVDNRIVVSPPGREVSTPTATASRHGRSA